MSQSAPSGSVGDASLLTALHQYWLLTKPRVLSLIVFCALIGMALAAGMWNYQLALVDPALSWHTFVAALIGIWWVAGAAAAVNCLIEQKIDALMARTRARPLPRGQLSSGQTLGFSLVLGAAGLGVLGYWVNALTMWLTLATFLGYAIVYTAWLKPSTPQNIVIGGASGAMPPVLGWAAITNTVSTEAWVLFLLIFVWTPPHFWALALYRTDEYRRAGLPMLPVTHGSNFTRLHIFLYTVLLTATTALPFVIRMSGWLYLVVAMILNAYFIYYAWKLLKKYSDALAKKAFAFSILYLTVLFAALLLDQWIEQRGWW